MKLQKIASLVLALIMIFSLGITAFADNEPITSGTFKDTKGSVTINGVGTDATYSIYRMLDLMSFNITEGAHSYKINSKWAAFFALDATKAHVEVDAQGYVKWIGSEDDSVVAAFAQSALAWAKENGITPEKTSANAGEFVVTGGDGGTGVFSDLPLGWYLVDTNVGALCGITTTNPNASVNAKNGRPTVEKQVKEDSTNNWGEHNSADIGQTVEFRATILVQAGAQKYVLHDKMGAGFTFGIVDGVTYGAVTEVRHVRPSVDSVGTVVAADQYTIATSATDGCTFEIIFKDEFCKNLEANDKIIVSYYAMLNRDAVIAGEGNINEVWVSFGEKPGNEQFRSESDTVVTKTFGIDIIKTDAGNKLIDGAEFKIFDAETKGTGNEIAVVPYKYATDGKTVEIYRRARANETGVNIVVAGGEVRVVGFDNGTYYLEEVVVPEGYNELAARHKFIISEANLDATFNDGVYSVGSGVQVINKTGAMLPETGGMGTTLFYVVGGLLVGGAVVALVSKKRMSSK